ncbi:MAG: hypothetical protein GY934_22020 [Gammaproteobacteria bacterium]|nr:hypothetical protein [Gammaproteobacteria bacterium]
MSPQSPRSNDTILKNTAIIVGFLISFGGLLITTGVSLNKIDVLTRDVAALKVGGCDPANKVDSHYEAIMVRLDSIKTDMDRVERQSQKMNDKQDAQLVKIIDSLLP